MIESIKLNFTHCAYCDSWGEAKYEEHPMLTRVRQLEKEGRHDVTMLWEDCVICVKHGAPDNSKVHIELEMKSDETLV